MRLFRDVGITTFQPDIGTCFQTKSFPDPCKWIGRVSHFAVLTRIASLYRCTAAWAAVRTAAIESWPSRQLHPCPHVAEPQETAECCYSGTAAIAPAGGDISLCM